MIDFYNFDEFSIPMSVKTLFWGLYMVIFVFTIWKLLRLRIKSQQIAEIPKPKLFILYFALYAVFYCINSDYFNYREWVRMPFFEDWEKEQVYFLIIQFCRMLPINYHFEMFRLIVWGGGLLLVFYTAKMYRDLLMPGWVILFLFVFYSSVYCYARASLAMAVYFMGISLLLCKKEPLWKILGMVLVVYSYSFHHQMIVGIVVLPFILLPFEKKRILFISLLLLVIIMVGVAFIMSNPEFMETTFGYDDLAEKIEQYNEAEQKAFRMSTFIRYLNIFYPFFLITVIFQKHKHQPKAITKLYRITFALLLVSVAFFMVSGSRSVYTYRVLYIAIIPMSIMIAYCHKQNYFKSYHLVIMLLLALLTNSVHFINTL